MRECTILYINYGIFPDGLYYCTTYILMSHGQSLAIWAVPAGLQRNKDIPIAVLINKYDVVTSAPSTTGAFDVLTLEDVRDAMGLDALQVGHID